MGYANPLMVYKSLKSRYFWKNIREEIRNVIMTCEQCLLYNEDWKNNEFFHILICESMDKIGIDTMCPFIQTRKGNKLIVL